MTPKTALHREILETSKKLSPIKEKVKHWMFEKCLPHEGNRTKKATKCLSCGHVYKGKPAVKSEKCPGCDRRLTIADTLKLKSEHVMYAMAYDTIGRFQVNRFFQLHTFHKGGEAPRVYFMEIFQQWINLNGKNEVVGNNVGSMGSYVSNNWHGGMEIRDRSTLLYKYNFHTDLVYPKKKILPELIRNGFSEELLKKYTPYELMGIICKNSIGETLLKSKNFAMIKALINREKDVVKHWKSIKIALRNKYNLNQMSTWLDYLDLLKFFGKDLCSTKYICPANLHKEHDRYVAKKREIDRQQEVSKRIKKAVEEQKLYEKAKGKFFGIIFSEGPITIKVLETIEEFIKEGDTHKHCVYTNEYYKKAESLIFSAMVNGKPTETIELSLTRWMIMQSRGIQNKASKHNKEIIDLMTRNIPVIKKALRPLKKQKEKLNQAAA
jgi:hypothetical protein